MKPSSAGFGRAIAKAVMEVNDRVVARQREEFASQVPARSFGAILDVTDDARIQPTIGRVERVTGRINVVVIYSGNCHGKVLGTNSMWTSTPPPMVLNSPIRATAQTKGPSHCH